MRSGSAGSTTIVTRAISEPTGSGIGRSNEARSTRPSAAAAAAQNCIENFRSSAVVGAGWMSTRSEEHTSELQSRGHLVCRLLLEKKKKRMKQKPTMQY